MSTPFKIYGAIGLVGGLFTLAVVSSTRLQNYLADLATNLAVKALDTFVTLDDDNDRQSQTQKPKPEILVGVGVILCKGSKVLIGRRINSTGASTFAVPGGRLEYGESFLYRGLEELYEETGIIIPHPHTTKSPDLYPPFTHDPGAISPRQRPSSSNNNSNTGITPFEGGFQNILCPLENCQLLVRYVICEMSKDDRQEPKRMEPDKCEGWSWVEWSDLVRLARLNEEIYRHKAQQLEKQRLQDGHGLGDSTQSSTLPTHTDGVDKQDVLRPPPPYEECTASTTTSCDTPQHNNSSDPTLLHHPLTPSAPDLHEATDAFSPDFPLVAGRDNLFAPLHHLLLSSFDPFTLKSSHTTGQIGQSDVF